MTSGYSGTPLPKKLGIKEDHRLALLNAPARFKATLKPMPAGVTLVTESQDVAFDVILFFTKSRVELQSAFSSLAKRLVPNGGLWIAWPKRASGVTTDLTEDVVREVGLRVGLVDNKVCAIDETWSGLRFVYRRADRPKKKTAR
jgi:hypothetical protein